MPGCQFKTCQYKKCGIKICMGAISRIDCYSFGTREYNM
jgi:hypothetical protein